MVQVQSDLHGTFTLVKKIMAWVTWICCVFIKLFVEHFFNSLSLLLLFGCLTFTV